MQAEYDIIIVGGGLTGASLASCLAETPVRIAVVEAVSINSGRQPSYDEKGLALSLSSQRIFNAIGVWQELRHHAIPIEHIHVSDRGRFGFVRLHAEEAGLPALGYVVIARELGAALLARMAAASKVDFICPAEVTAVNQLADGVSVVIDKEGNRETLSGKLLVAAQGSHSPLREEAGIRVVTKDYQQTAIVCNVTPERPHANTAYERFTGSGPLALLPLSEQRCAVVLTVHNGDKERFLAMPDTEFLSELERRFGRRLGRFTKAGRRRSYPLVLMVTEEQVRDRTVFLGNAVHTIHPNGAQGFNLCLRDVAGLAETLTGAVRDGLDPGRVEVLESYFAARRADQRRVIRFSDSLAEIFYKPGPVKALARNAGMLLTDLAPGIKTELITRATGLGGGQPRMVYGP